MIKHYPTILLLLLTAFGAQAQIKEHLTANNLNVGIPIGGVLFYYADTLDSNLYSADTLVALFEAPKGSSITAVYSSALWFTGKDAGGNLHCSAQRYNQDEFFDGPIASNYNQAYRDYYNRVFKITRAQVEAHKQMSFPLSALQVDNALRIWPGKGNPFVNSFHQVNIASTLAPFVDVNGDGIYDPTQGDYPDFCGEEAIFFSFNDVNGPAGPTGASFGLEVRGLAEVMVDNNATLPYHKRVLNNTLFVHYEVENKSTTSYNDFRMGVTEDMDLGCFENDHIGCDTVRNLMTTYNGMQVDIDCQGTPGYKGSSAAHGLLLLNQELAAFGYYNNDNSTRSSDPNNDIQYYNYMHGTWKDGTPFYYGSNGTGINNTVVTHMFPGNPNVSTEWSAINQQGGPPITAGDRRSYGSTPSSNFNVGETKIFDIAYFVSYDTATDGSVTFTTIVDTLLRDADIIQAFYNNEIAACRATQQPVGISEKKELALSVYPNPSSHVVNVQCGNTIDAATLTDMLGRQVLSAAPHAKNIQLNVADLAKGIYLLRIDAGTQHAVKRIAIE